MIKSIIPKTVKSKVLLIVTAIVWKTSLLWGLKQVFVTTVTACTNCQPLCH